MAFASAPDPLAVISLGRADLRHVAGIAAHLSDHPPLVRFGSLQRFPAALCCSRLPASNNPASALGQADSTTFRLSTYPALAVFSPRDTWPPASRSGYRRLMRVIRRTISSFRCSGPATGRLRPDRDNWLISRYRSWDLIPSQFFSGSTGVRVFGSHEPTCRFCRRPLAGSCVRFYVPRTCSPSGERRVVCSASASGLWPREPAVPLGLPAPL